MRKLVIFTACVLCSIASLQAQQKFNVQNGTKAEFYDGLEEAIEKAASGDTIYLPGGIIQVQGDIVVIDKKLTIIGAGWDVDSIGGLQATKIERAANNAYCAINFREGSDGSLLMGCELRGVTFGHRNEFNEDRQNIQNITIWRNKIPTVTLGVSTTNNNVENIFIKENYISNTFDGKNASNCWINNNLMYHISNLNNSHIYNNVITSITPTLSISSLKECIIENNFIAGKGNVLSSFDSYIDNCSFNNNAFESSDISFPNWTSIGFNNLIDQGAIYTFQINDLGLPKNLVIRDTSPCKNAGTDGTDIGIFGGSTPYKAGAVPFNPHIDKAVISSQTDKDGKLHIDITVSAQDR